MRTHFNAPLDPALPTAARRPRPTFYRSMEEFEREELSPNRTSVWSLEDLYSDVPSVGEGSLIPNVFPPEPQEPEPERSQRELGLHWS